MPHHEVVDEGGSETRDQDHRHVVAIQVRLHVEAADEPALDAADILGIEKVVEVDSLWVDVARSQALLGLAAESLPLGRSGFSGSWWPQGS